MSNLISEIQIGDACGGKLRLLLYYKYPNLRPSIVTVEKLTPSVIYASGRKFSIKDGMEIPWDRNSLSQDFVIRASDNRIAEILEEWDTEAKCTKLISRLKSFDWDSLNLKQLEKLIEILTAVTSIES